MGNLVALLWILFLSAMPVAWAQGSTVPVELTAEERAWLDQNPDKLVLYFNLEFPPVEFSSPNGTFKGLGADMAALIEKRLGVTFQRRPSANWDQSLAALASGACALAPTIVRTAERERFVCFTPPYAIVPVVIIATRAMKNGTTLNDLSGLRVAVVTGFAAEGHVRRHAAERFEVVPMPDTIHGLRAAAFGQVDAFVENLGIAGYYIEKEGLVNLRVVGDADFEYALAMGVSYKYPLLFSAVQKAFAAISDPELEQIRRRWITLNEGPGMSPETRRLLMLAAAFTTLLLLGLAGITYFLKRRLNEKMASLKRTQQELNVQNERLALAMDATEAGVWDYDPIAERLYVGPQLYAMLGYAEGPENLSLEEWFSFVYFEDAQATDKIIRDYIAGGGHGEFQAEFRLRNADGVWCWLLARGRTVTWDDKGVPARIMGLNLNIQNIKAVQEELAQSEARFRAFFKMAPTAFSELSLDGRVLQVNDGYLQLIGYTIEECPTLEKCWELAFPDSDYRESAITDWRSALDRIRKQSTLIPANEYQVACKDGTVRTLLIGASLIGKSLLVSFHDITEREQEETVRAENLELLRATLNTTPDGVLVVNQARRVTHVNPQFYRMWCIPEALQTTDDEKALLSAVLDQLVDPDLFLAKVNALYDSDRDDFGEIRFKDGRVYERYSSPMIVKGKKIGRVWNIRDITARRHAEGERQKLQAQLLQAQKLEAVGILAGGVAHDFNNMLGAIIGFTELSMAGIEADAPLRENLGKVLDAAQRSTNLTRQLLAFARKQTVAPMVLDLNESVAGMLKMLRRLIGENIDLAWRPGPRACTVKMDPSQLDQILANLCVNARDAIADVGKITIRSGTVRFDETDCQAYPDCVPGEYVLLAVSDDGSGMDNETLTHLFEPFFTTKGAGRGTGLGMATVYGIVQQNHGFIHIDSQPGMGTTINIYIPRHAARVDEAPHVAASESVPLSRGECLLLVEDDPTLRQMGEMMLQRLGYGVLSAATPSEAIALAEQSDTEFQMFLTDVVMPEMNGRELADRILARRPSVKHLFMSGYTSDIIAHRGVLDEGVNFIQKPFSLKELALKLRAVLDGA